jgi:polyketide cyclase/dehydrase/lipid transport protein
MLQIDRTACAEIAAAPRRCLAVLAAVERYPIWSRFITAAEARGRRSDGTAERVGLRAGVAGLSVELECVLELTADRAVLRRIPDDERDDERYEATWTVGAAGEGSRVELRVVAGLDVPGPAGLLAGRVARRLVDDVLADFAREAAESAG